MRKGESILNSKPAGGGKHVALVSYDILTSKKKKKTGNRQVTAYYCDRKLQNKTLVLCCCYSSTQIDINNPRIKAFISLGILLKF